MPKNIREFTPEEKIQRAYDMIQIKNVMGRHAYLHACNRHDIEMEICWAHKAPNISWGNAGGFQIGRDVVWSFYVKPHIGHGPKPGEGQDHPPDRDRRGWPDRPGHVVHPRLHLRPRRPHGS